MIDEELLKPSREHIAYLDAKIKQSEVDTIEKIKRGSWLADYSDELWRRHHLAVEPMRRERDHVARVIADYYGQQAIPTILFQSEDVK
jgi:hypothetical protein